MGTNRDSAGLYFHQRKRSGAQWIYRYILHGRRREMGLGVLRNVSLKNPVNWQHNGILFFIRAFTGMKSYLWL